MRRLVFILICLSAAAPATFATRIGDVTHLQGRRNNRLQGLGLVIGLPGTGDGGKYAPSIQALASMLMKFENAVSPELLKDTKNVALVAIEVVLPDNGVREGDRVDVQVSAIGACKSLLGGRLMIAPLQGPDLKEIFAFASGPCTIEDIKAPTTAIVREGAILEADVVHQYIDGQSLTLVLDDAHASWALASTIAQLINEETSPGGQLQRLARADGPKSVSVAIPSSELRDPAAFIAAVESIEIFMPPGEARVTINRRKGTVVITGEVEIGAALISYNGMTISTVQPPPVPTPETPVVQNSTVAVVDPAKAGGAKLKDLVDALNALQLPARDLIAIIEDLHRSGKLHAKLVMED